jgi:hypothetical protein
VSLQRKVIKCEAQKKKKKKKKVKENVISIKKKVKRGKEKVER